MLTARSLLAATCVAVFLGAPARAHDDGRLHFHVNGHVNGAAIHADEIAAAPVRALSWFARVPAPVWGITSLAVAATLLRRRRATTMLLRRTCAAAGGARARA